MTLISLCQFFKVINTLEIEIRMIKQDGLGSSENSVLVLLEIRWILFDQYDFDFQFIGCT